MVKHYYNEFDPKAAAWLRELITEGHIPKGDVDERSITEVRPAELVGYTQCHFFCGIGGWPYALQLAGWPIDRRVWTGSCPCQPFSSAGKQKGNADDRHLWPAFFELIRGYNAISQREPVPIFGEQVSSAIRHGWLDGIRTDLEGEGYTIGHAVLGAHSVGSPHIRQRLYWVAHSNTDRCNQRRASVAKAWNDGIKRNGIAGGMALSTSQRINGRSAATEQGGRSSTQDRGGVGDTFQPRLEGLSGDGHDSHEPGRIAAAQGGSVAQAGTVSGLEHSTCGGEVAEEQPRSWYGPVSTSHWTPFDLIPCRDGKARRVKPGLRVLAHGVSNRVGLLRGYGNAIVPQVAAAFIEEFMINDPSP